MPTLDRETTARGVREWLPEEPPDPRCPRCGAGDLLVTRVLRGDEEPVALEFCVGVYDRGRRRFIRRSCGYAARPVPTPS